jgi:Zn-dependent protease with chaperone function
MSTTFTGTFFDGLTLAGHPVEATIEHGRLHLAGLADPRDYALNTIQFSDRLASVPRFLQLPDGASIESTDNAAIDAALAAQQTRRLDSIVHWLEARSQVAAVASVLLVIALFCLVHFGLPALARKTAMSLPASVHKQADRVALRSVGSFTLPSTLSHPDRQRVISQYQRLTLPRELSAIDFQFRSMPEQPNALALPGGTIVFTDEMVRLATDDEIAAVIAHEIGHIHHRHGMQRILSSSAALLLISLVTGDLSALTATAATLPLTLVQLGYSREFEVEADAYAVTLLKHSNIDSAHLASILHKLEAHSPSGRSINYLSTHPATSERIKLIAPHWKAPERTVPAPNAEQTAPSIELIPKN